MYVGPTATSQSQAPPLPSLPVTGKCSTRHYFTSTHITVPAGDSSVKQNNQEAGLAAMVTGGDISPTEGN